MAKLSSLKGKTLFITGSSRGIGLAIGKKAAKDGANVVIIAKTTEPHPKLEGTIFTAAEEIEAAGGKALPIAVDVRDEDAVKAAVEKAVETFGGIDILVNNASTVQLTNTEQTTLKRWDLMQNINLRGTFICTQACLPYLKKSDNPHIMTISPPLNMDAKWFKDCLAYSVSKYGMSMCVLGMSAEFKPQGIAVNALWPKSTIATAAIQNLLGGDEMMRRSRTTDIVAEAAAAIFKRDSKTCTGNFFIDEDVMREEGVTDFTKYAIDPEAELAPDLYMPGF